MNVRLSTGKLLFSISIAAASTVLSGCRSDAETETADADVAVADTSTVDTTRAGSMVLSSPGINSGVMLDAFRCEQKDSAGSSESLPLAWSGVPAGTGALAVTMHHYPMGTTTNPSSYFSLWNIDPTVNSIDHGTAEDGPWFMGSNKDGGGIGYTSPCSPSGSGDEYILTLYALSETPASLPGESSLDVSYTELVAAF